jgi:hypothetical protein
MPTRRMCCRLGCEAKYEGDQPANWRHLLMFWSARPISSFAAFRTQRGIAMACYVRNTQQNWKPC